MMSIIKQQNNKIIITTNKIDYIMIKTIKF